MKVQYDKKENKILDAASRLILHHGFDKTTVAEIAKEAGIAKGTIYLSFKSKNQIMESLLLREMYRHNIKWLALIEADPQGGLLPQMYMNQLKAMHDSDFMTAIFKKDVRILGSYIGKEGSFLREASSTTIRKEFVKMMQDAHCIRKDWKPEVVAHIMDMIAYSLVGIGDVKKMEDTPPFDEVMEGLAKMMHLAFAPEDGDSDRGKQVLRTVVENAKKAYGLESEGSND